MISYNIASKIISKLPPELIPVGSYARGKRFIKDLDFVTTASLDKIAKDIGNIRGAAITRVIASGDKYLAFVLRINGVNIPIDIWHTSESSLPFALFSRIGPQSFNIRTRALAKYRGYKLTDDGLYSVTTGKKISSLFRDDRDIFAFLGITPVAPHMRQ